MLDFILTARSMFMKGVLELLQENINLQKRRDLFCHHLSWGNLVDEDIKKVRASLIPEVFALQLLL